MSNIFQKVQMPRIGSSKFDLSHDIKMSFNMGELVPTTVMDIIPGDRVQINVENMLRFAPLIAPVMHKVKIRTDYFFVPQRLLWSEWEDFITGSSEVEPPYIDSWNGLLEGTLGDYMGLPINTTTATLKASAFPFAAYLKIYDDYYRDQNLQAETFDGLIAGNNVAESIFTAIISPLKKRAWMHDYFTSALPFAQKGDAVTLPLTTAQSVPVELRTLGLGDSYLPTKGVTSIGGQIPAGDTNWDTSGNMQSNLVDATVDPNGQWVVDLNDGAVDITTLRRALKLQEFLEMNARGGTRYIENIQAHFDVVSSDKRLQRPEWIGGATQNMVISEVLSTAQTNDELGEIDNPVGQMAGHGISAGGSNTFSYRAEEHGWIIGIINVQPVTAYQQGLHRKFSRETALDYYWPSFAHIGEQAILNKELFAYGVPLEDTFGYIPRYSEYKYEISRVAGKMRTNLDFWTLSRIFETTPFLNSDFIECDPRRDIFAVTDENEDTIYAHIFNNITAIRKMPKFGNPKLI